MDVLLPLAIGLVGAIIGWGLSQVALGPRVAFSHEISVRPSKSSPSRELARIKMHNLSRLRSVVDLQVEAKLYIPNLLPENRNSVLAVTLRTSTDAENHMAPRTVRLVTVDTTHIDTFYRQRLLDHDLDAFAEKAERTLKDWLELEPVDAGWASETAEVKASRPYLVLVVSCADAWSGARRTRSTPRYASTELYELRFKTHARVFAITLDKLAVWLRAPHDGLAKLRGRYDRVLQLDDDAEHDPSH